MSFELIQTQTLQPQNHWNVAENMVLESLANSDMFGIKTHVLSIILDTIWSQHRTWYQAVIKFIT